MSPINWDFEKTLDTQITREQKRIWEEFLNWLRMKVIETKWDFKADWHWRISSNKDVVRIDSNNKSVTFK